MKNLLQYRRNTSCIAPQELAHDSWDSSKKAGAFLESENFTFLWNFPTGSLAGDNVKTKLPLLAAIFLNLLVWNYFISGSWGSFFSLGYFIFLHVIISVAAMTLLWLLSRRFLSSKKTSRSLLFLLSILVAYLPPVFTMWFAYAAPQLLALVFEELSTLLLVVVLTVAASVYYWIPLGIANYFLLQAYSIRVRSSGDTANK
jgi:hypothetical protein